MIWHEIVGLHAPMLEDNDLQLSGGGLQDNVVLHEMRFRLRVSQEMQPVVSTLQHQRAFTCY